jgi:hypothetical protein
MRNLKKVNKLKKSNTKGEKGQACHHRLQEGENLSQQLEYPLKMQGEGSQKLWSLMIKKTMSLPQVL